MIHVSGLDDDQANGRIRASLHRRAASERSSADAKYRAGSASHIVDPSPLPARIVVRGVVGWPRPGVLAMTRAWPTTAWRCARASAPSVRAVRQAADDVSRWLAW